jgi:Flp pilus assembly protein TadG
MMPGLTSIYGRFIASTRATAAIEFAAIMPVLLILFLSSYDAANGIAIYMKVRSATYALAAISNQYGTGSTSQISTGTMTAITGAATQILAPYSSTPAVVVISQIKATSAAAATVSWSYSPTSGHALTGSYTLPTNFAKNSCNNTYPCYFIYATVSYAYTPSFGTFMSGTINLSDSLYVTPRVSQCVQYNGVPALSGKNCT